MPENQPSVSTGRKIWECVNPLVFLFVCMLACSFAVMFCVFAVSFTQMGSMEQMMRRMAESTLIADLVFYAVALVVKGRKTGYEKYRYHHTSSHWPVWKCILAGAAVFGLSFGVSALLDLSRLSELFTDYAEASDAAFAGQNPFLLILVVVVIGPIAEEIIFRLMVFGRIRFYFGSRWAILVSSLLFGLYHMNIVQFVYCSILGILLSGVYEKSGNLWIPIGVHMVNNFIGILPYLV